MNFKHVVTKFNVYYFVFVLWGVVLVCFPMGEEFSASVWDQCQPSIMKNSVNN